MKYRFQTLIASGAVLVSPMALAHDHSLTTGFVAGLLHPVTGIDHLFALMLAGFFIGRQRSSQWIAISGLLLALGSGAAGGQLLGAQAWTEAAVLLSLPLFLAMQWLKHRCIVSLAVLTMSLLMFAHGWSHGVEGAAMNTGFVVGLLMMSTAVLSLFSLIGRAAMSGSSTVSHAHR